MTGSALMRWTLYTDAIACKEGEVRRGRGLAIAPGRRVADLCWRGFGLQDAPKTLQVAPKTPQVAQHSPTWPQDAPT